MKGKKKREAFSLVGKLFLTNNVRNYNKIAPKKQEKNTLFQIMGDISTYLEMKFHIHNPTISAITIIKWSIVGILMDILKLKKMFNL